MTIPLAMIQKYVADTQLSACFLYHFKISHTLTIDAFYPPNAGGERNGYCPPRALDSGGEQSTAPPRSQILGGNDFLQKSFPPKIFRSPPGFWGGTPPFWGGTPPKRPKSVPPQAFGGQIFGKIGSSPPGWGGTAPPSLWDLGGNTAPPGL